MDFERPNNSRTSNKRDEIRAAYSPKARPRWAANSPHLRRTRDIPPAKTGTLTGGSGRVQAGRWADGPMSLMGHSRHFERAQATSS
jgi:hypothetical protein